MRSLLSVVSLLALIPPLTAQAAGSRGGHVSQSAAAPAGLDPFAAEHYITVDGSAEVRVVPTALRIVFALTSEGDTAKACQQQRAELEQALRAALTAAGLGEQTLMFDFISMLPVYEWRIEEQSGARVTVERLRGYRVQDNAHVRVANEAQARAVIAAAAGVGVGEVLAIDYWADGLDQAKVRAQERALGEAKRKADLLLGAAFAQRPLPINVQEQTAVYYPTDLYMSFESAVAGSVQPWSNNLPAIAAPRPKSTYYHGSFHPVDVREGGLPMAPEIAVVSRVRLYFASPGRPSTPPEAKR